MRLHYGPIEADRLGARVAATLSQRFDGVKFSFDATRIARTEHGPTITVDHLVAVSDGRKIIEAPRAELSLDPIALLKFQVMPRRLEVFNLVVRLQVRPDGSLAITAGAPDEEAVVVTHPAQPVTPPGGADEPGGASPNTPDKFTDKPRRSAILRGATNALRALFDLTTSPRSPLAELQLVAVRGGKLVVDDRTADRTTTFDDLDMAFEKSWRATTLDMQANTPSGKFEALAKATGTPTTERQLDIEVKGVSMEEIGIVAGARHLAVDSDASLSFKLRFVLAANQRLREASGRALVGPGYLRLEDPDHEPLFFEEISGAFRWDPATRQIIVSPVQFFAGETQFVFEGALQTPLRAEDGWKISLGLAKPGGYAPERPNEKFLAVDKFSLDGRLLFEQKRFDIARFELVGPEVGFAAAGAFDWVNGAHVRLGASMARMPVRSLFRIWPSHMGAPARNWLIGHLHAGTLESCKLSVDFDKNALLSMRNDRPPPDEAMQIDFQLAGATVTAMRGIPDLIGLDGVGKASGRSLLFKIAAAAVQTGPGRKLTLTNGAFALPYFDGVRPTPARAEARVAGSIEAVSELLAREPIRDVAAMPLEPGTLKGNVDGQLRLEFYIGSLARSGDVKVFVNSNITNFSADNLIGKEKFENGTLAVTGDPTGLRATGNGRIFGGPATLDLRKDVGKPALATLSATIDDNARAKFGADPAGVTGPMGLKISAKFEDDETDANVEVDLARTSLDNPIPGLSKPAGRPGRATFRIVQHEKSTRIENLVFEAGGASARGIVELSPQGEIQNVKLSQAKLSPGDDMRVDISRTGGGYKASVRGVSIDGRPFIKFLNRTSAAGRKSGDFELDLKTPILTGFSRQALTNVDLKLTLKGGLIRSALGSGQFGRGAVALRTTPNESGRLKIDVGATNAGALLAFSDIYPRMEGGVLNTVMSQEAGGLVGTVKIRNFHLRDEPALRRLVNESAPRADAPGARVDPGLVGFDRLEVVFLRNGSHLVLRDGVLNGPNIGLTIEGTADTEDNTVALNGTFIPAYTVNNFFSKIPVVGLLLGGGWNEGLFAVNYKVTGRVSAPRVSVNPLTVAPGILRKMFGILDNVGDQPQR
ncbi:MAG: AsmA-like C-terminal domain-containing protein [Rhodoblastus sp.]